MHRFHLPPEQCRGSFLDLTGREAHHGLHVLRLRRGDTVVVLDGAGTELLCEALELGRDTVRLAVRQRNIVPPPPCKITLAQAIPKGKLFDAIIQKASELGVARVVPLLSERVVTQLSAEKSEGRIEHWRMTAVEAIKQCGSAWLPRVDGPLTPREFLDQGESFELHLIASLQPDSRHPREWFKAFEQEHRRKPQSICVWVGPEGDFTPAELAAAQLAGAWPITLGRLVLRSETAAVYCLSVLNYELQSS